MQIQNVGVCHESNKGKGKKRRQIQPAAAARAGSGDVRAALRAKGGRRRHMWRVEAVGQWSGSRWSGSARRAAARRSARAAQRASDFSIDYHDLD